MKIYGMLSLSLFALMALGIALPGKAEKPTDRGQGNRPQITVREIDEKEDTRVFQLWYGHQMRDYNRIDPETGERLSELIQMVVDVSDKKLLVTDDSNLRRGVIITSRTRISREYGYGKFGRDDDHDRKPTSGYGRYNSFHRGDLIVVEGYLRGGGGVIATTIRIVGRARGYGDDDDRPGNYGFRTWGEITNINARKGYIVVDIDRRERTVNLDRDTVIIINGRRQTIDQLHRGDRVVLYSKKIIGEVVTIAYRIVVLPDRESYPDGDRPYMYDPDYSDYHPASAVLEGELVYIKNGVAFDLMVIHGENGTEYSVRISKGMQVYGRDGKDISPRDLRPKQKLRIFYDKVDGNLFGERLEIK